MNAKEITVLMIEPGKHPKVTTLQDDLDSLQKAVSIGADTKALLRSSAWETVTASYATRKAS